MKLVFQEWASNYRRYVPILSVTDHSITASFLDLIGLSTVADEATSFFSLFNVIQRNHLLSIIAHCQIISTAISDHCIIICSNRC